MTVQEVFGGGEIDGELKEVTNLLIKKRRRKMMLGKEIDGKVHT